MICVECTYSDIDVLYSKFKSQYIRLKVCPNCGKVADKYIEFDNVILFLDLLLLKPQAYRHVAYNETEKEIIHNLEYYQIDSSEGNSLHLSIKNILRTYRKLFRFLLMYILFEVYLTWAYEEKKSTHSVSMNFILSQEIYLQYFYFILKSLTEVTILNSCIQFIFHKFFQWDDVRSINLPRASQQGYSKSVLFITVLMSSSIRLFPILMLIWPYDNSTDSSLFINLVGFFNTIEAMKVVTSKKYLHIIGTVLLSILVEQVVSKLILSTIISSLSGVSLSDILISEWIDFLVKLHGYESLVYSSIERVFSI
ncbi:protein Arv1p [[Candida] railenensis]|uniref:Protein ARV n=1 Tax=[Candida] railenensis TaxID=45579 RepID=A0A9P0QMG0_9ASCO|nr:protein Arv1p [[Candida] railenensis]